MIDLTGSDDGNSPSMSTALNQNLWGGEEVRVCNPCVPDPNYDPPQGLPPASHQLGRSPHSQLPAPRGQRAASAGQTPGAMPWFSLSSGGTVGPFNGGPSGVHQGQGRGVLPGQPGAHIPTAPYPYGQPSYHPPPPYQHSFGVNPLHQQPPIGPSSAPSTQYRFRNPSSVRDLWPPTQPPHLPGSASSLPLPSQPEQRAIPEEDECPICQSELPPKGPNGETTEREKHVMDCITAVSRGERAEAREEEEAQSARNVARSGAMGFLARLTGEATASTGSSYSMVTAAMSGPGTPERGGSSSRRLTGSRCVYYVATEKDCLGDGGERQECIICFEEFEVGAEMARLDCWCKFHKVSLNISGIIHDQVANAISSGLYPRLVCNERTRKLSNSSIA
jgi:hypothetical protein